MSGERSNSCDFAVQAAAPRFSLLRELWDFLRHNKKWWLLPIILALVALSALALLSSGGLAPLIYTIF
jgi:hypothetical protein